MQFRTFVSTVVVAVSIGFVAGSAFTEDAPPSEEEMMKMMMELGKPGEAHKALHPFAGEFTVESKMWMKPGEDPKVSKATSTSEMWLGGRFLKMRYKGDWNGMEFEGAGLLGYDNFKKQYVSIWVDSMSSGIQHSSGATNGDGNIEMNSVWEGPMGKMPNRMVYDVVDENTYTLTSWMSQGDQEMKHMELTFKRKAAHATDCR